MVPHFVPSTGTRVQQVGAKESFGGAQRSVTYDFLRYINILTYLLSYLLT